jgi:hypothetical protein
MMNKNLDQQELDFIGSNICVKLEICFPHQANECRAKILSAKNITSSLGLVERVYPNLDSVHKAVSRKKLKLDINSVQACQDAIDSLQCSDPLVINSFDVLDPSNFDQSFNLLNSNQSCRRMVY